MVKITNNINTFVVSRGAFKSIFERQGYFEVEEAVSAPVEESGEGNDENPQSEDEKFLQDLVEKPVSQWSKAEVKKYVDLKGIDTTGASTLADVKELIKSTIS